MKRRFKIKKVFNSLLISYIIMLILPSIFIWRLYHQVFNLTIENCAKDNITMLSQVAAGFDKYLESLDERSMRLVYDMDFNAIMHMDKPRPAENTVCDIVEFSDRLYERLSFIGGDMGYFVILKDNEFIFTNNFVVYGLKFYFDNFRTYHTMTYQEWFEQVFNSKNRILFPMSSIEINGKIVDAITYNYPIKGGRNWGTRGVVQFLITREYIEGLFFPVINENNGAACILDSSGNTIAYTGTQDSVSTKDFNCMKENEGYFYSYDEGDKKIVVYTKSPKSGLIFAVFLPETLVMMKAIEVKHAAILFIFIYMVVEILICILFSWKYAAPIKNIIRNLRSIFTSNIFDDILSTNEYEYLEKSVSHLIKNNQSMRLDIEKKHKEMRQYFINHLLEGQFKDKGDLKRLAQQAGILLDMHMYCVASFEIGEKAEEAAYKIFENEYNNSHIRILFYHVYNRKVITVLFGFEEKDIQRNRKHMNQVLINLNNEIFSIFNRHINIGTGRMYEDIMDIPFSFTQSYYCATIKSEQRKNFILEYEAVSQDINTIYYPIELESKLINSTKHGETQQVELIFDQIYHENVELRNLSPTMGNMLVANIEATLVKIYSDVVSDKRIDDVIELVHKYTELSDILCELESQFVLVSEYIEQNKNERIIKLKYNMEQYIRQNYMDPTLCVSSMADYFALSETYFSQLFKEVMGEPFSMYIETMRIDKAKELLLSSSLNIEQITSSVGYSNSTTFRRAFKRVVGISPSAYRAENNRTKNI